MVGAGSIHLKANQHRQLWHGAYGHSGDRPVYPMQTAGQHKAASPRFLACGDHIGEQGTYFVGAVVTLTGTVAPAKTYQVQYLGCVSTKSPWKAVYSGTVYATKDSTCIVTLPGLNVSQAVAWKEPVSSPFNWPYH